MVLQGLKAASNEARANINLAQPFGLLLAVIPDVILKRSERETGKPPYSVILGFDGVKSPGLRSNPFEFTLPNSSIAFTYIAILSVTC